MILKLKFLIFLSVFVVVLGQTCEYSYKKAGKCQDASDCFGPSATDCQNKPVCLQKSVQKCREYEKFVYKETFSGALTLRSMIQNISECNIEVTPLIVGGTDAKIKEFPHMVAIGYGEGIKTVQWICGGSLISEKFVLTAAHCSGGGGGKIPKYARIGSVKLKKIDDFNSQDFHIIKIINHPEYKPPSLYNDIALYELSRSVKLNEFARPACLHASFEFNFDKVIATGWGKTDYDANEGSEDLKKVYLNRIDYSICNSSFSEEFGGLEMQKGILSSQFCAGELKGGKDTCQGDSGGPLQIITNDPYCTYTIVGITSVGKFCGFENAPALYTRVSCFIPWIESIVWPE